jgi:hypothetical protein
VGSDVPEAGELPKLPVRVFELAGIVVSRGNPPEERAGTVHLGDAALQVFAILRLGHSPDPFAVVITSSARTLAAFRWAMCSGSDTRHAT